MSYFERFLKEDEELVVIVRRFWLSYSVPLCASIALVLLVFFFVVPLWQAGLWGQAIWMVALLGSSWWFLRNVVVAYSNCFVITSLRVIDVDQKGLFERVVTEAQYGKIQDVSYKTKGVWQTTLSLGTVIIQTAGSQVNLELSHVRKPAQLQRLVTDLQRSYEGRIGGRSETEGNLGELSARELLALVKKIKYGLGEEKFKNLLK